MDSQNEEIIYFDSLGLGWVVDMRVIMAVFSPNMIEESVGENAIFDGICKVQCGW